MERFFWEGEYTDGQTARVRRVSIRFDGMFLLVRDVDRNESIGQWLPADIAAEPGVRDNVVILKRKDATGECLELHGVGIKAELREVGVGIGGLPDRSGRRVVLAMALILGIVAFAALIWSLVPTVSQAIARKVPLEVERQLSGYVEQALSDSYCVSDEAQVVLDSVMLRLAGEGHALAPVHILNISIPNAFAMPGGGIVLTRGLVESAEHPDEVAGVLAHEIQHVKQRHVMAGMIRGALLSTLWAVSVGDYSGLMIVDPSTAFQIATLQFSREDEASADRGAIAMLDGAGIRRDGFRDFFERLETDEGSIPEWLSTHPASGSRAESAVQVANPIPTTPALDEVEWDTLAQGCDSAGEPESDLSDFFL